MTPQRTVVKNTEGRYCRPQRPPTSGAPADLRGAAEGGGVQAFDTGQERCIAPTNSRTKPSEMRFFLFWGRSDADPGQKFPLWKGWLLFYSKKTKK